jgi:hypothetical protein
VKEFDGAQGSKMTDISSVKYEGLIYLRDAMEAGKV